MRMLDLGAHCRSEWGREAIYVLVILSLGLYILMFGTVTPNRKPSSWTASLATEHARDARAASLFTEPARDVRAGSLVTEPARDGRAASLVTEDAGDARTASLVTEDARDALAASQQTTFVQGDTQHPKSCSFQTRRQRMLDVCRHATSVSIEKGLHLARQQNESLALGAITFDTVTKVLNCRLNKVANTAADSFFAGLNEDKTLSYFRKYSAFEESIYNSKRNSSLFVKVRVFPLAQSLKNHAKYRKMIIVRHPLQRLVSAYYQVVLMKMKDGIGIKDFKQFISKRVLNATWPTNYHWLDYQDSCHPCAMDFHYNLKIETLDSDIQELNGILGLDPSYTFPHRRVSNSHRLTTTSGTYKYDSLLRDLERESPALFQKLLDRFRVDMEMFGYTWGREGSGCDYIDEECC